MTQKTFKKPLKLVVSAIHSLKEKNGSSPQRIIRYLEGKYNLSAEQLKSHVQAGLKRGVAFGMLIQDCGLYRLSGTVDGTLERSSSTFPGPPQTKMKGLGKQARRRKRGFGKKRIDRLTKRRLGCICQMKKRNNKRQGKSHAGKKRGGGRDRNKDKRSKQRRQKRTKENVKQKKSSEIRVIGEKKIEKMPVSTEKFRFVCK